MRALSAATLLQVGAAALAVCVLSACEKAPAVSSASAVAPVASLPVSASAASRSASASAPKSYKPTWAQLSPAQRLALAPLEPEWDRIEPVRKQKWLEIANRFSSMSYEEQTRVHEKMRALFVMTPEERRKVRENLTKVNKADAVKKSELWEQYQQLPEEQKQKLAAEAAQKKQVANIATPSQAKVKTVAPVPTPALAAAAGSAPVVAPVPASVPPASAPAAVAPPALAPSALPMPAAPSASASASASSAPPPPVASSPATLPNAK